MAEEILLEAVDHRDGTVEYAAVGGAGHQQRFGAEHFGHFGQHGGAARRDQQVGKTADQRIRGNAGEAVGTAALQADFKFGNRNRFAFEALRLRGQFFEQFQPLFVLAAVILRFQETHARQVAAFEPRPETFERVVFAAERDDQHAARIGVLHQRGEDFRGHLMVAPEL